MTEENLCTYMTDNAVMPFCKGCGHSQILRKLDEALSDLKIDPLDVCLVTDIGCIGLTDALFDKVHTVHTTHGRSTAFATGIALADKTLTKGKLKTIVLIGDGGAMIGLLHIVNAALLNTDLTVIVCNNFLFGMTGGQVSSLTPTEFITQTTPLGNINPPIDVCQTVLASKAEFTARLTSSDKNLKDIFTKAIHYNGFALVEVLELCTEYATGKNPLKGSNLPEYAEKDDHKMGIISDNTQRQEFSTRYLNHTISKNVRHEILQGITTSKNHNLLSKQHIIIGGSAGEKVQSSASILCQAALISGLLTTQKNDNPVTQGSGFSLSEIILSPEEIHYTGIDTSDYVIIVSQDGYNELISQNLLNRINDETILILDDIIDSSDLKGNIIKHPFRKLCGNNKAALGAINYYVRTFLPFKENIFTPLIEKKYGDYKNIFKAGYYNLT